MRNYLLSTKEVKGHVSSYSEWTLNRWYFDQICYKKNGKISQNPRIPSSNPGQGNDVLYKKKWIISDAVFAVSVTINGIVFVLRKIFALSVITCGIESCVLAEYYNLQGHSSLTPIYLYIYKMNFGRLRTKTHTHNYSMPWYWIGMIELCLEGWCCNWFTLYCLHVYCRSRRHCAFIVCFCRDAMICDCILSLMTQISLSAGHSKGLDAQEPVSCYSCSIHTLQCAHCALHKYNTQQLYN